MEQIEIKSKWLAYALGARNNKITLEELHNTRILDFSLLEYLRGNKDIFLNQVNELVPDNERINETNTFISELSRIMQYEEFNVEHINLSGLNFKETNLDCIYNMKQLQGLNLEENSNCEIDLSKLENIKQMNLSLIDVETKEIDISDYTKKTMGLSYLPTQYDMYLASKQKHFSDVAVDVSDIETISKYTNNMPTISIKDVQDVKKIRKLGLDNVQVCLRTGEIQDLVELSQLVDHVNELVEKNMGFNQVIDNVSELSVEQLNVINEKVSPKAFFDSIKVFKYIDNYEQYDINKYIKIKDKIEELIGDIDPNLPDVDKFVAVQNAIIYNIYFDQSAEYENENRQYFKEHELSSRNLEGGLLEQKCVCAGYADILRNMLECVNIESNFVKGTANKHGHAWNQVKIDYDWYNTDLTADRYNIIQGLTPYFCLKSDFEFYKDDMHTVSEFDKKGLCLKQCDKSYNVSVLNNIIGTQLHECSPELIIDTVNGMRKVDETEYNIAFAQTEQQDLQVGTVYEENGEKKSQLTKMYIDKENIGEFMRTYFNKYEKSCNAKNDKDLTYISAKEGVGLIIGSSIRKRLHAEGIIDLRNEQEKEEYCSTKGFPVDMVPNTSRNVEADGMEER